MTEITQADRDAAASGYFAWCSGNPVIPERMKAGNADDHSMVQAFARHRTEERAAIVAWLRKLSGYDATTPTFQDRRLAYQLAALDFSNAIEAGEHLK